MGKKINFNVDKFQLLEDSENSQLSTLKMWIVSEGGNRHNIPISWESIQDAKASLVGKPVLAYHDKLFNKLGGHDKGETAVGVFLRSEDIFEEQDVDGKRWLGANCYLWKKYYPEIIEVLRNNDGETAVSMEIEVLGGTDNGDGFEDISLFSFMGVTLIGVEPAIPNARAEVLQFSTLVKETEEIVKYSSGYKGLDFTIPSPVKMNSEKGLKLYETHKRGGNGYSLSMARYITKQTKIEPSRVKKLHQSLNNKSKQEMTSNSDSQISFLLLGGGESLAWCKELMAGMENADANKSSHFTLNTGNGTETEDNTLKKIKEEFVTGEGEVIEEKMAGGVEGKEENIPEEQPFAETPAEEKNEDPAEEAGESKEDEKKEQKMADEETPAEDAKETPSEEDKEEARMSLNGYADVAATLQMLELESDTNEGLASQYVSPEAGKQFSILVSKFKELYEQNTSLKEFKAEIEAKQFAFAVNSTLEEVANIMPKKELDECRVKSATFTLATIDAWKNEVKALAFNFAKDGKLNDEKDDVTRIGFPFTNFKVEKTESLWG